MAAELERLLWPQARCRPSLSAVVPSQLLCLVKEALLAALKAISQGVIEETLVLIKHDIWPRHLLICAHRHNNSAKLASIRTRSAS